MTTPAVNARRVARSASVGILAVWVLTLTARGELPNVLVDLGAGTLPRPRPFTLASAPPCNDSQLRVADGRLTAAIRGRAYAGAGWFIPIDSAVRATCEIRFSVRARNIAAFATMPNLAVVLGRTDGPEERLVPVYSAVGASDSEFGTATFSTAAGDWRLKGLRLALALRKDGEGRFELRDLTIAFTGNLPDNDALIDTLRTPPEHAAAVQRNNSGNLVFSVDDHIVPPLVFEPRASADETWLRQLRQTAGIRLLRVKLNLGGPCAAFPDSRPLWLYPEYLDTQQLDALLRPLCQAETWVLIDIVLATPPTWWTDSDTDGDTDGDTAAAVCDLDPLWRQYGERAIKAVLAHLRTQQYGGRVVGCSVILGPCGNNIPAPARAAQPAYLSAFRQWLKHRYADPRALQQAWQRPGLTFRDAIPLAPETWARGAVLGLVHPRAQRRLDSAVFYNQSWAETLRHFARIVKDASSGRLLCGLVDGPALFMNQLWDNAHRVDHDALRQLIDSPEFDFFEVPADTTDVRAAGGAGGNSLLLADILEHQGKRLVVRQDMHPHLAGVRDADTALDMQKRLFGAALARHAALFVRPRRAGDCRSPAWLRRWRRFGEIMRRAGSVPPGPRPRIVFAVDPDTFRYLAPDPDQAMVMPGAGKNGDRAPRASRQFYLCEQPRSAWTRLGAPYQVVAIDELEPEACDVIVFFRILHLTDHRRQLIRRARGGGRMLVWSWADGAVGNDVISPHELLDTAGIPLRLLNAPTAFRLQPAPEMRAFLDGRRPAGYLGRRWAYREQERRHVSFIPRPIPREDVGTVLARYRDGSPALVIKAEDSCSWLYSASPYINPEVLRAAAAETDVHLYLDSGDWSAIGRGFVTIHADDDGIRVLRLPAAAPLYEVFRDQEVAAAPEHHLELDAGNTYCFFLGSREQWTGSEQ